MKRAALLLLLAAASPAAAQLRTFSSAVPAVRITPTNSLPAGPSQQLDDYCTSKVVAPRGRAARSIVARGWHVTGETRAGGLTVVSFVGGLMPGTSGVCLVDGGNVGLFEGERLVAIVHMARDDGAPLRRIGSTAVPGRLRLWSEEYSAPLADLVTQGERVAVVPIASEESWCGGIPVPNPFGVAIDVARQRFLARGWRPAPPPAADIAAITGGRDFDLRRAGIVEVEACSGTGFGLCVFNYRHPRGASLTVQTAGEGSEVVDIGVECRSRPARLRN